MDDNDVLRAARAAMGAPARAPVTGRARPGRPFKEPTVHQAWVLYHEGYTPAQIAAAFNVSADTVRRRLAWHREHAPVPPEGI